MRHRLEIILCLAVTLALLGCGHFRVFQKTVPKNLTEKPPAQLEGERRAGAFIDNRSAPPVADPKKALEEIHEVSGPLRASLGEPEKPVTAEDKDAIIASLRTGLKAKEQQLEAWKTFGRKYGGTTLEGTGVDLAGPTGLLVLAAVVAACIFVPGFGYLLLRVVPMLWSALRGTAVAVENFAAKAPAAAAQLKAELSRAHGQGQKKLIGRLRDRIKAHEIDPLPST